MDSPLPDWTNYSAAANYPPARLPAVVLLHRDHYVPLFYRRGFTRAQMVEPALRGWKETLPNIRQAFPLPQDNNALKAHFDTL